MKPTQQKLIGLCLVFFQFLLIALLLFLMPKHLHYLSTTIQICAVLIGLWAVWTFKLSRLNILPTPKLETPLIQIGPYQFIRHPMYCAILLFFGSVLFNTPSKLYLSLYAMLIVVLVVKLLYEEHLLKMQNPAYKTYMKHTWRLLPFIF